MKYEYNIPELTNFSGTIGELQDILAELLDSYGEDAIIKFDAGYNNVDVSVVVDFYYNRIRL